MYKNKLDQNELLEIIRPFTSMAGLSIPAPEMIKSIINTTDNQKIKKVLTEILGDIQKGKGLSESFSGYAPAFFTNMLQTGEKTNNLYFTLKQLADYYEKESNLEKKINTALFYPMLILITSVFVFFFIYIYIMPAFINEYDNLNFKLPLVTLIYETIFKTIQKWQITISLLVLIFIFIVINNKYKWKYTLKSILKTFALILTGYVIYSIYAPFLWVYLIFFLIIMFYKSRWKLNLLAFFPYMKKIYIKASIIKYFDLMILFMSMNYPITKAMTESISVIDNPYLKKDLLIVNDSVNKGRSLKDSFSDAKVFNKYSLLNPDSSDIYLSMKTASYNLEREVSNLSIGLAMLIEPVALIIIGIFILLMLSNVWDTIYHFISILG